MLAVPADPANDPFSIGCLRDWLDPLGTPGPAAASLLTGTDGAVRASGLVLSGSATGNAGRPPLLTKADLDAGLQATKRFNLVWQDESALPYDEALVLASKARRFFYANDRFFPASNADYYPESGGDPLAPGPVVGFIAAPMCSDEPPGTGRQSICPQARMGDLQRDSTLVFVTRAGVSPSFRRASPSSLPSSAVAFDKSQFPGGGDSGSVFYVACRANSLLVAVPGQTPNISTTLRLPGSPSGWPWRWRPRRRSPGTRRRRCGWPRGFLEAERNSLNSLFRC